MPWPRWYMCTAAEPLPPSDPEIMDWMADVMAEAEAAALGKNRSSAATLSFINLNTGYTYSPELGFFVALDGAARLPRLLPTAGLVSYSPPGSLYQVGPMYAWAGRGAGMRCGWLGIRIICSCHSQALHFCAGQTA